MRYLSILMGVIVLISAGRSGDNTQVVVSYPDVSIEAPLLRLQLTDLWTQPYTNHKDKPLESLSRESRRSRKGSTRTSSSTWCRFSARNRVDALNDALNHQKTKESEISTTLNTALASTTWSLLHDLWFNVKAYYLGIIGKVWFIYVPTWLSNNIIARSYLHVLHILG